MGSLPFVVLFGPPGAGKSTVLAGLVAAESPAAIRVVTVTEPVDAMERSGALADVYACRPGSGFRLQMLVLAERVSTYWQAEARIAALRREDARDNIVVVADGHFALDRLLFAAEHRRNGRMTAAEEWQLQKATRKAAALCPPWAVTPTLYAHVRVSGAECAARARARGRAAETAADLAFFKNLAFACDEAADRLPSDAVARVNGAAPPADVLKDVLYHVTHHRCMWSPPDSEALARTTITIFAFLAGVVLLTTATVCGF